MGCAPAFSTPKIWRPECCGSKRCENTLSRTGRLQCVRVRIRIASGVQQSSACFSPPQTLTKSNEKTLMRWRRGMKMEELSRSKRPSAHTTKKKQKAAFNQKNGRKCDMATPLVTSPRIVAQKNSKDATQQELFRNIQVFTHDKRQHDNRNENGQIPAVCVAQSLHGHRKCVEEHRRAKWLVQQGKEGQRCCDLSDSPPTAPNLWLQHPGASKHAITWQIKNCWT